MPSGTIQHDLALGTDSAFKGPEVALLLNQQFYFTLLLHQPDTCTLNAKYLKMAILLSLSMMALVNQVCSWERELRTFVTPR